MKEKKQSPLERKLDEQSFENAVEAIKGGKKSGSLNNPELVEELVEKFKGKTVSAPVEVITTSAIFLSAKELLATIDALRYTTRIKIAAELRDEMEKNGDVLPAILASTLTGEE